MTFSFVNNVSFLFLGLLLMIGCAQQSSPQGGPRDEVPPTLDTLASTPNEQIHFEKQNIKIVFNEFVDIKQPGKLVLISPPMDINPRIYARGKEIRVEMPEEEELKENATYVFNFGNAIRDYTEGNEVENFSFIFSTGPYIDSLSIQGKVVDAYSGEPSEETLVMLYEEVEDSVVYKSRPFYFTRTEEDGSFTIQNLRADTFKIFALKDDNVNYLYDLDTELIGFLDSLIVVSLATDKAVYDLEVFSPTPEFDLVEYDVKTYGQMILLFNQAADSVNVQASIEMEYFDPQLSGDSLIIWYDQSVDSGFEIYVENKGSFYDTLKIRQLSKADFLEKNKFKKDKDNLGREKLLKPKSKPSITFNSPIQNIDSNKCFLFQDSIIVPDVTFEIDTVKRSSIFITSDFLVDSIYVLKIDSGAVMNIFNQVNDSLELDFTVANEAAYGKMIIHVDTFDFNSNYILELLSDDNIVRSEIITQDEKKLIFELLEPKAYTLRLTKDDNKNGKWDPGSYIDKKFSEKIATKEIEAIREGWENEVTISMDVFERKQMENPTEEIIKE